MVGCPSHLISSPGCEDFLKSLRATNDEFLPQYLDWLKAALFPTECGREAKLRYWQFLDLMFARDVAGMKRLISQAHWQVAVVG